MTDGRDKFWTFNISARVWSAISFPNENIMFYNTISKENISSFQNFNQNLKKLNRFRVWMRYASQIFLWRTDGINSEHSKFGLEFETLSHSQMKISCFISPFSRKTNLVFRTSIKTLKSWTVFMCEWDMRVKFFCDGRTPFCDGRTLSH